MTLLLFVFLILMKLRLSYIRCRHRNLILFFSFLLWLILTLNIFFMSPISHPYSSLLPSPTPSPTPSHTPSPEPHSSFVGPTSPFPSNSSVVVLVLSFYADIAARDVIRETWASNHSNVYFVIGAPCPIPVADRVEYFCERQHESSIENQTKYDAECEQSQQRVDVEQAKHQDLIRITDVHECYRNLGGKLKAAYLWGILNTPARWFVKTDDDSFLRVSSLSYYLLNSWPDATVPRGVGEVKPHAIVDHTGERTSGRNKELPEYKKDFYP